MVYGLQDDLLLADGHIKEAVLAAPIVDGTALRNNASGVLTICKQQATALRIGAKLRCLATPEKG